MQVEHSAIASYEHDERNRFHSAAFGERFGIDDRLPWQWLHGQEPHEVVALLVEVDADDLEALVAELFVVPLDVGDFLLAWTAPRGPEIDQHELAFVRFPIERLAVESRAFDDQRLADQIGAFAAGGDHRHRLFRDVRIRMVFETGFELRVDLSGQFITSRVFELLGKEGQLLKHALARLASDELVDGGKQLLRRQRFVFGDGVRPFVDAALQQDSQFAEPFERRENAFVFGVFERCVDGRHRGKAKFGAGRLLQSDGRARHSVEQFDVTSGAFQRGVDRVDHRLRFARGARQQLGHRHFQLRDVANLLQGGRLRFHQLHTELPQRHFHLRHADLGHLQQGEFLAASRFDVLLFRRFRRENLVRQRYASFKPCRDVRQQVAIIPRRRLGRLQLLQPD